MEAGGWASPAMPMRYVEAARIANEGVRLERGHGVVELRLPRGRSLNTVPVRTNKIGH